MIGKACKLVKLISINSRHQFSANEQVCRSLEAAYADS